LCDGGVGSGHGMAQSSIPSAKLGQSSNCGMAESFAPRQMLHFHGKKRLIDHAARVFPPKQVEKAARPRPVRTEGSDRNA
jgi:hypothetical protein